ncbi:MAG: YlxM family DNA-binding protein [Eubacterium sp.]|nr:YlxM family DNA-binding protein [Eubacterium sp.]
MEEFVTRSLLFDFYGELLTEHQRKVYQAVVFEDYSVSEVARDEGISRQGVHDMMKRCDRMLEDYEEKLHLVERFLMIRRKIGEIRSLTEEGSEIDRIAGTILEEI